MVSGPRRLAVGTIDSLNEHRRCAGGRLRAAARALYDYAVIRSHFQSLDLCSSFFTLAISFGPSLSSRQLVDTPTHARLESLLPWANRQTSSELDSYITRESGTQLPS